MGQKFLNFDSNAKTIKGQKKGFLTGILYLAPSIESGYNVCPFASPGCSKSCLYTAGRGVYQNIKNTRIAKTKLFFENKNEFLKQLRDDIKRGIRKAQRENFTLVIRLNGTSDIAFENFDIMQEFQNIQFYDYTKNPMRMRKYLAGKMPKNYHLTFSLHENNEKYAKEFLNKGGNVAVVFKTRHFESIPKEYLGFPVIKGDDSDLRFLDPSPSIIGLTMKGQARKDEIGFVKDIENIKELAA